MTDMGGDDVDMLAGRNRQCPSSRARDGFISSRIEANMFGGEPNYFVQKMAS